MKTTYPVISQTYSPEETLRTSTTREILPATAKYNNVELYIPAGISTTWTMPVKFVKVAETVSGLAFRRYKPGSTVVSDFEIRAYQGNDSDTATFVTLSTYGNANTITNTMTPTNKRDVFVQVNSRRTSGVFVSGGFTVGMTGKTGGLSVSFTDADSHGYIKILDGASDPVGASNGSMYYSTATGKIRFLTSGTWKDVA